MVEPLHTILKAAKLLGVPAYALRRAIARGEVPAYQPFSKRFLVKVSEVEAAIRSARLEVGQ